MIWFALLIPLLIGIATWLLFPKLVTWQEIIIGFSAAVVISGLIGVCCCAASASSQTADVEMLTAWITSANYYEPWTEEWTEIVFDYDEKGNVRGSHVETHRQYHSACWAMVDSLGETCYISKDLYRWFCERFGNESKVLLHHFNQVSYGDGNKYQTLFPGQHEKIVPRTVTHRYENRVQASHSVFRFPDVDPEGLYGYPATGDSLNVPSILGRAKGVDEANTELCIRNAELGSRKQVRIWILLFENQPVQRAIDQQSFWQGGNKNEVVICIGHKQQEVQWAFVFSWCEDEKLKTDIKMHIQDQQELDLMDVVNYSTAQIENRFVRKQFKDFSYLHIEPSLAATITAYVLTTITSLGIAVLLVKEDFNELTKGNNTCFHRRTSRWSVK